MFELGWVEVLVIGIIALVVLGPERLPKAARFAGLWVRKARAQWFAVKAEMERELDAEALKSSMGADAKGMRNALGDATKALDDVADSVRRDLRSANRSIEIPDDEQSPVERDKKAPDEPPPPAEKPAAHG